MDKQKIVRRTEEIAEAVAGMHKAMEKSKVDTIDKQTRLSEFQKKYPDALYLEPANRIPTGGIPHPEREAL